MAMLWLAEAGATLAAAYWVCLIVGGGLLLLSALGGLGHGDMGVDAHGGVDFHADTDAGAHFGGADAHADSGIGADHAGDLGGAAHAAAGHGHAADFSTWFSIRFLIVFLAVFGAFGVILPYMAAGPWATFAVAFGGGVVVGQAAHQVLRVMRRNAGNSTPLPQDYVERLGRVTVPIDGTAQGEVAIQVRGGERYVPAAASDGQQKFTVGDEIVVVAYRGGVATVVARAAYEPARPA